MRQGSVSVIAWSWRRVMTRSSFGARAESLEFDPPASRRSDTLTWPQARQAARADRLDHQPP